MKTKLALIFTALVAVSTAQAQNLLSDDFSGGSLNTSLWTTILPTGSSAITQSGGLLTTTGRGVLGTVGGFTAPYAVSGTFTMLDASEHFNIALRTDLSTTGAGSSYERRGVLVSFSNNADQISIQRFNTALDWDLLTVASYTLSTGQSYAFSIVDTGTTVSLAIDGMAQLSASTGYSTGDKLAFYSRELGSTATAIDSVQVAVVPEPGTWGLIAGLAGLGIALLGCRKSVIKRQWLT